MYRSKFTRFVVVVVVVSDVGKFSLYRSKFTKDLFLFFSDVGKFSLYRSKFTGFCFVFQMLVKQQRSDHLLTSLLLDMPPAIRRTATHTLLTTEILPYLVDIIMPSFRPVSEGGGWEGGREGGGHITLPPHH